MAESLNDLKKRYAGLGVKTGRGRLLLLCMAERIELEEGDGPHPKPKNAIERAIYEFLKLCQSGEISYVKELLDRMDGKPGQRVELTGEDGNPLKIERIVRRIVDPQPTGPETTENRPTIQ